MTKKRDLCSRLQVGEKNGCGSVKLAALSESDAPPTYDLALPYVRVRDTHLKQFLDCTDTFRHASVAFVAFTQFTIALAGCDFPALHAVQQSHSSAIANDKIARTSIQPPGNPRECTAGCVPLAAYIARAQLGLDPIISGITQNSTPPSVVANLQFGSALTGGQLSNVSIDDALQYLDAFGPLPILLTREDGHLYLALGTIEIDGRSHCQLLHGRDAPVLIEREQLLASGFRDAWRFDQPSAGIKLPVGSGCVTVDKVMHNFGEIKPNQQLECSFKLTNAGEAVISLDRPHASCGCTASDILKRTQLTPGSSKQIRITVDTLDKAYLMESVRLSFDVGGVSRSLNLLLFGNRRPLLEVSPRYIDFGLVGQTDSVCRTIRLTEVATDHFSSVDVTVGNLPIQYVVERSATRDQFAVFRVHLCLAGKELAPGKHEGQIVLNTDSRNASSIPVGLRFEIPHRVSVVPPAVAFGVVGVGDPLVQSVKLVSHNEPLRASLESAPDGATVEIDENVSPAEIRISFAPDRLGQWEGTIRLKVSSASWSEVLTLPCSAHVCSE